MSSKLYVELDTDIIKYVYAKVGRGKVGIKKWGSKSMPGGTFVNGKVENKEELIKLLSAIKKELRIWSCKVYLSLRDGSIITRPISLPILGEKDIEKHLCLEAEQYIPINRDSYQVSFKLIEKVLSDDETGSSIMIAAAPKESIYSILECFDKCRLGIRVFDVYPNNVYRLLNNLDEDNIALIDIGSRGINITITENRYFYMHSYLQFNMESVLDSFRKDCSISIEEFHSRYYYNEFDFDSINADLQAAEEGIEAVLSVMLSQISRYLDHFNSRHFGRTVDRVYVIGEYGMLRGLKHIMGDSFRTAVTIGMKPMKVLNKSSSLFKGAQMNYYNLLGMILRGSKI